MEQREPAFETLASDLGACRFIHVVARRGSKLGKILLPKKAKRVG